MDDLVVIAESKAYRWKNEVQSKGVKVNVNKTKVMITA